MTPVATKQRMNAEEFFDWCNRPENRDRHFELERGEVVEVARPGERHGFVCLNPDFRTRVADLFYLPGEEAPSVPPGAG
jgi:hypothetical protein